MVLYLVCYACRYEPKQWPVHLDRPPNLRLVDWLPLNDLLGRNSPPYHPNLLLPTERPIIVHYIVDHQKACCCWYCGLSEMNFNMDSCQTLEQDSIRCRLTRCCTEVPFVTFNSFILKEIPQKTSFAFKDPYTCSVSLKV